MKFHIFHKHYSQSPAVLAKVACKKHGEFCNETFISNLHLRKCMDCPKEYWVKRAFPHEKVHGIIIALKDAGPEFWD